MKIAIMQPYIFPYIGYFQLIKAVETFVFYDDVNFIKRGWINRNNLLINMEKKMFTIPCKSISQNKKINKTIVDYDSFRVEKLLSSINHSYSNSPQFNSVYPLLESFFKNTRALKISELAIESVKLVSKYLELNTKFVISSEQFSDTMHFHKEERLIEISKSLNASHYINPIGGLELYYKSNFLDNNIKLSFLKSKDISYKQFDNEFVPWLSIIDVLMFNSRSLILQMLDEYKLV